MEFDKLNLHELDRNLSEDEKAEWNAIYASYRAGSLLTGRVAGMDTTKLTVLNHETGENETREINCLIVISYRIKVLIPDTQIWYDSEETKPSHVLRSMTGAVIDYVITGIDREGECCTASRSRALYIRRRAFLKLPPKVNKRIECQIIAIGRDRMLCSAGGFDVTLRASDISYAMVPDLKERFHTGDIKEAVVKEYDAESGTLYLSLKEAQPHPFDGAELRHPINSRRASVITGKYRGGVFCRLEENLDCLCTYSPAQYDADFRIGDQVIVVITKYADRKKQVYGKIVAKW